jgi:hypothetical protein
LAPEREDEHLGSAKATVDKPTKQHVGRHAVRKTKESDMKRVRTPAALLGAVLALLWLTSGCVTAEEETLDPEEPVAAGEDDEDDDDTGKTANGTDDDDDDDDDDPAANSNIASTGDDDDDGDDTGNIDDDDDDGDGDDDENPIVTSPSDFVGTEQLTSAAPATGDVQCPNVPAWAQINGGGAPAQVSQSDIVLECQKVGAGLLAGFVRYGCNAMMRDGSGHYGMVLGWWQVLRQDGARAHAKHLNFREAGYDMTFDLPAADPWRSAAGRAASWRCLMGFFGASSGMKSAGPGFPRSPPFQAGARRAEHDSWTMGRTSRSSCHIP